MTDERASAARRGYGRRWRQARELFLRAHPLCVACGRHGLVVPATVVDHITPHKGNRKLFWDRSNWQALCKGCHDEKTLGEQGKSQYKMPGCTTGGYPTDPRHPWAQ